MPGYDPNFLDGVTLPIPTFSTELSAEIFNAGELFEYPNYSIVMNKASEKRAAIIVCFNLNQNLLKETARSDRWRIDPRIGFAHQLNNDYYARNDWDRGHMARRASAAWGQSQRDAQYAADETFYYSNSCLQHMNLNQDEWLALEDWVKDLNLDKDGKISVFAGPFWGAYDRTVRPSGRPLALVPAGFFKVVCFINQNTNALDVRAFVIYQDEAALRDKAGRHRYNNQHYQVTITEIEQLTGLRFDDAIYESNPLYFSRARTKPEENVTLVPELIEVSGPGDIVSHGDRRQTIKDDMVDIFIAAAMVNPTGIDAGKEWISLINLGSEVIDVSGWYLIDDKGHKLDITAAVADPASRLLKPGQSLLLDAIQPLSLSNNKGVIQLYAADSARIDWVNYHQGMIKSGATVSFLIPRDTLDI